MPENIQAIIAIIGAIAFFAGLFGGFKAKDIEVSSLPFMLRVISFIVGILFIGIAIWPFVRDQVLVSPTPTALAVILPTTIPSSEQTGELTTEPTHTPSPPINTPVPKPTNTPKSTNTPRPTPTPVTIRRGDVIFSDDYSDPTSGWKQSETSERSMDYNEGAYRYTVQLRSMPYDWYKIDLPGNNIFSDFILDIDITFVSGPVDGYSSYGVTFRNQAEMYQDDSNLHEYHFLINARGDYSVFKQVGSGEGIDLGTEQGAVGIKKGHATNHLTIVAEGSKISVFANDQWLRTIQDTSMDSGIIQFNIGATDDIEIRFDNLAIYGLTNQ